MTTPPELIKNQGLEDDEQHRASRSDPIGPWSPLPGGA